MMLRRIFKKTDDFFFGSFQNQYARELEREVEGCSSLLDVGCGADSPVKYFSGRIKYSVGIDAFQPSIDRSREKKIHSEYFLMNVMEMDRKFPLASFDCVIASDLIEHLEKKDGYKLIEMMTRLAKKKVIIFTPNGFLEQREYDGNSYQVHLSGWSIDEMKDLGFRVRGINGWKVLRGEFAGIKWWPKVFWGRISLLTQLLVTKNPRSAFAIMCVKDMNQ